MTPIAFRIAHSSDAAEILQIYAHYVEQTAITLDTVVPSIADFQTKITTTLERYPFIVAVQANKIVGYAYASAFNYRNTYDWSAELSIYLLPTMRKQGLGSRFYSLLEDIAKAQNITNLNACITYPRTKDDPHVTLASVNFHEKRGFNLCGHFHKCAYKFDRWYDMVWMEKQILPHSDSPAPIKPFNQIAKQFFS